MDPVVHFEIPAKDMARASNFYSSVFGWQIKAESMSGMNYTIAKTVDVDGTTHLPKTSGAINGGFISSTPEINGVVLAMTVSSIDDYIKKIETVGGKLIKPKMDMGGMGYYAYVSDTEGNVIGLWEEIKKD